MALPICPELGPSRSQPYSNSNSRTPAPPLLLIPAKPTFLGLPIEVRFMIYRYLLPEIFRVSKVSKESDFFNKNNNHRYQNVRDSSPQFTELLEVCSQVRKEAAPILYEMVYALHWQDVQLWFWCYRNNHVQYINTLAVDFAELPPRPGPRMIGATGPDVPWLNGIRCLTSLPGLRRCLAIIRCGPSSGIGVDQYKVLRNALREVADCLRRHQRHLKFELQLLFVFEGHGLQVSNLTSIILFELFLTWAGVPCALDTTRRNGRIPIWVASA